jgi:hypothetical protein
MKHKKVSVAIAIAFLLPIKLMAGGYSEYENHKIWQLRLAAAQYASKEAERKCGWHPESEIRFTDQLPSTWNVSNEGLFLEIMTMLRFDQNARDIAFALEDKKSNARLWEVDEGNLPELKRIISTYGFPTVEEVGLEGANAMMVMVAHADQDLEFQKSAAIKMDEAVARGELPSYFPEVLRTIRPRIAEVSQTSDSDAANSRQDTGAVNSHQETDESPRECYETNNKNLFHSYIRSHYK